jgi:hypothetical protein
MGLIAKVQVTAWKDGEKVFFQPGDEVTGLSEHDIGQLKRMDAIEDEAETAKAAKRAAAEAKKDGVEFQVARAAVQAAADSVKPETPADGAAPAA